MKKQIAECFIHLSLVAAQSNVVMRTNNTNSLLIAMWFKQFYDTSLKLWLEFGTVKNTIRYISIDQACENLGSLLCNVPAYHAFTGCDYTTSFKWKGKVARLKLLEKNTKARWKLTKLDGSSWPPCSWVLVQKIKGSMFVARRWRCSYMQFQPTSEP